jgi:hypothetical protein
VSQNHFWMTGCETEFECRRPPNWRLAMQDVIMLLFTAAFFVVAFLYVKACQKLR